MELVDDVVPLDVPELLDVVPLEPLDVELLLVDDALDVDAPLATSDSARSARKSSAPVSAVHATSTTDAAPPAMATRSIPTP